MDNETDRENQVREGIVTGVKFDVLTEADAERLSVLSIEAASEVTNPKLGFPNPASECATCGAKDMKHCEGHFGVIKFPYTILHPYFISEVVQILNKICPGCKSIRRELRGKGAKSMSIQDHIRGCKYCVGRYPSMRFRLSSNDLFRKTAITVEVIEPLHKKFQSKNLGYSLPDDYWDFVPRDFQVEGSHSAKRRVLSYAQVHYLLKDIDPRFIEEFVSRRDALFLNCFPVTPNCHRVIEFMHPLANGQKLVFDDRTRAFRKLVDFRGTANELGCRVLDCLKLSKLRLEKSNDDSLLTTIDTALNTSASKWMKEVVLTKRSNHIFRTVVTGDPNVKLNEIGIPCYIAERLLISDYLNSWNWDKLIARCNLRLLEKGEVYVRRKGDLIRIRGMDEFQIGDVIHRPLADGDIILINRPPSIHQHSHLALYVKILPISSVVAINPLCCAPLRGDFDGDCLHGYVPQSIEARVELKELVGLDRQLTNGQSGRNLLSLSHDSLTAAYLVLAEGDLLDKFQIQQLAMLCPWQSLPTDAAFVKAGFTKSHLWTGQQLFSMLLPPDFDYLSQTNGVQVSKGELLSCPNGSSWMRGDDEDGNFFESLVKHSGSEFLHFLDAAQSTLCEWLSMRGLSVSLSDLYLSPDEHSHKNMIQEVSCGLQEAEGICHLKQLMVESSINYFTGNDEENVSAMFSNMDQLCCQTQKSAALSRASVGAFKQVFRDVQNLTYQYANTDNSLLSMINSGSKSGLLKIVQQSMCIGLQHSLIPLSFRLPHKLSCSAWNDLKKSNSGSKDGDVPDYTRVFIPYAVVESPFLSGLNPLECFVHSVTSRDGSFSENADVPGTLTRRLMFFMRDLYVAYDGTVRNACGNQLIQFSYGSKKEGTFACDSADVAFDENSSDGSVVGGLPVGSQGACAISEAAYSALDQPVSVLETSPLLNLKKVMESGLRRSNNNKIYSLFLSEKLRRSRHGFEYAALEFKDHLEKVLFSDIVSTVMIVYAPQSLNQVNVCPWVCHFHLCKETMRRRRLKLHSVIDALNKTCKYSGSLSSLQILNKKCCVADIGNKNNAALCITVTMVEYSKNSHTEWHTFRDVVIPYLLKSVVKGLPEVDKVDILWNDQPDESRSKKQTYGELYLRVTLSTKNRKEKLWNVLMDACLPIMGLIDWTRSHPDDLHDMFLSYGVDAAWRCFLGNLKSAMSDVGKTVLPEHLLLVANCLSTSGEFVGLSAKGLTRQKKQVSVSSPFTQACFSSPGSSFIKTAKRGASDKLQGSLDALSWGKIPSIGTGSLFEFIYSGKEHQIEKPVDPYSLLGGKMSFHEQNVKPKVPNGVEFISEKSKAQPVPGLSAAKTIKSWVTIPESIIRDHITLNDVWKLSKKLKGILYESPIDQRLSDHANGALYFALYFHPRKKEKIGIGAVSFKVGYHSEYQDSRCFIVERKDGTIADFSYHKCIHGALQIIAPLRAKSYFRKWFNCNGLQKV